MSSEIHQNDIGTRLQITVKDDGDLVDVSNASVRQINIRKPSDVVINRTASIIGDGSESSGVMYYDTVVGDLDEVGQYKLQAKICLPSGTYYTDIYTFKVNCNI
jgi:hypothetical protein